MRVIMDAHYNTHKSGVLHVHTGICKCYNVHPVNKSTKVVCYHVHTGNCKRVIMCIQ